MLLSWHRGFTVTVWRGKSSVVSTLCVLHLSRQDPLQSLYSWQRFMKYFEGFFLCGTMSLGISFPLLLLQHDDHWENKPAKLYWRQLVHFPWDCFSSLVVKERCLTDPNNVENEIISFNLFSFFLQWVKSIFDKCKTLWIPKNDSCHGEVWQNWIIPLSSDILFSLRLPYLHDRMNQIIVQTLNNDHRNNLVKFEKDSLFHFWVFEY